MVHRGLKRNKKEDGSLQRQASLTVESAFVLPFFFIAVAIIAGILDLYRITALMQTAMGEGAKELGMYAYCGPEDQQSPVGVVQDGICMAYGQRKIRECLDGETLLGIKGGINGITLFDSGYRENLVILKASFFYQVPFGLFRLLPIPVTVESQARAWIGFEGTVFGGTEEKEEMVYITDWESVYHTSDSCTHLNLSVEGVSLSQAKSGRNEYGTRYHPCESCIGHGKENQIVYITQKGDAFHNHIHCGGISRSIKMVKKSETGAFRACERCGGKK